MGIRNGNRASITSLAGDYAVGEMLVRESREKADCLRKLRKELKTDTNKKFPDVEERCGISFADLLPNRKQL